MQVVDAQHAANLQDAAAQRAQVKLRRRALEPRSDALDERRNRGQDDEHREEERADGIGHVKLRRDLDQYCGYEDAHTLDYVAQHVQLRRDDVDVRMPG